MMAAAALLAVAASAVTPDAVARRYGLAGELLVAKGDRVLLDHLPAEMTLDQPLSKLGNFEHLGQMTMRQLLTHHSGLANPNVGIVFTNGSSDDFPPGEVWEGKGFVYDLLSAAACP